MVSPFHPGLLDYLHRVYGEHRALGLEALARAGGLAPRTVYRWHELLGEGLSYHPNIAYRALGLTHLHLFLTEPSPNAFACPYAIERAWTIAAPGKRVLYLHCVVPIEHAQRIANQYRGASVINSNDGWQHVADLATVLDATGRIIRGEEPQLPSWRAETVHRDLLASYPLIVPVLFELVHRWPSSQLLWQLIYQRLGEQVWQYLPRKVRRWRHNGKQYVQAVFRLLNRHALPQHHRIRFAPLQQHAIEILLDVRDEDALRSIARRCPLAEAYPSTKGYLVRATGDITLVRHLITTPDLRRWWFIDDEQTKAAPKVRFAYETLFDPSTASWQVA